MAGAWFFIAVIAACLLWSAAFIAAAARTRPGMTRRLLVAVAVGVPVLSLLPWTFMAAYLAFALQMETNWFAPTVTAAISVAVGGWWIARAGLAPRFAPVASAWPIVKLAVMFVAAKMVATGTLLFMDTAVMAEMRSARAEAMAIMQSVMPLALPADDDAAPLYLQAFERLEADPSLDDPNAPTKDFAADVTGATVTQLLARHATTLDILRRAADRPGCRFVRDWSRAGFDLRLPELQSLRDAGRFLALAARRNAAEGDGRAALADVVRLHRMATHIADEPCLISGLVAMAIDTVAIDTLVAILPHVSADDAAALDDVALGDFLRATPSLQRQLLGEEAFAISTFAGLANGSPHVAGLAASDGTSGWETRPGSDPLTVLYRCFLLPTDFDAYRIYLDRLRLLADDAAVCRTPYPQIRRSADEMEQALTKPPRKGIVTNILAPAPGIALQTTFKAKARARAAQVLLAATRARLANGALPEATETLVPDFLLTLPQDPFLEDGPLVVQIDGNGWLVYSVGPNGKDDGGPSRPGDEPPSASDDIGLRLERVR